MATNTGTGQEPNTAQTVINALGGLLGVTSGVLADQGILPPSQPPAPLPPDQFPAAPGMSPPAPVTTRTILPGLELVGVEGADLGTQEAVLFGSVKLGAWAGIILYLVVIILILAAVYMAMRPAPRRRTRRRALR